ncbi:hypothetical protein IWW36_002375 [Coemansia brasiliensis]|uniref:Uncharacterized protein n=1 Tax=Coemansia brasiliensis TaxID=2650707 RepID=A0A9W8IDK3_9FUNG|nr:hypothetical protein IWW36_002375 [Coemansia brasiliensis]
MVYQKAIVCCETDYEAIDMEQYMYSSLNTPDAPEKWITNVDLFVSNGLTKYAKEMYITLSTDIGVLYFIDELFEKLHVNSANWTQVTQLDFRICNVTADDDESHEQTASDLALVFSQYFSGVRQLRCEAQKGDHLSTAFTNTLVGCYTNDITNYSTTFSTPTTCPVFGKQLTHLEILQCCNAAKELIYIHASTIRHLTLNQLTYDFELVNYKTGSSPSKEITFENLETWCLSYIKPASFSLEERQEFLSQQTRCKVVAPKLRNLAISDYLSVFPLKFVSSTFRLASCRILCSTLAAQLFTEVKFPNLKDLILTLYKEKSAHGDDGPDIVATVNNIVDTARPSNSCTIFLESSITDIDPTNMKWSRITQLSINASITFGDMIKILDRTPNATIIAFHSLNINGEEAIDFVEKHRKANGAQQHCIMPLHFKVKSIRINVEKKGCPPGHAQAMKECISQCFPSHKIFEYFISS